ncbi:S8 family serine peptidase [Bailinhaonella thermotolerans]|uniref:Serine protease n=1 Tax=Bailinhaonella thermotolerans TaxID=1070861 RepID=A0A3A4BQS8_9ACTN|nr:S8 family serine peptidase [Bailinhaonella thermotolerans]RJL33496.1 serine protease [Bailinhaonella thermotolerans]
MLRRLLAGTLAACAALATAPPARADEVRASQRQVLNTLDVERAWQSTRGRGVTVAVLDSGVDAAHHDLAGSVVTGKDFTAGANPPGVPPRRLHGTYMASLIAGHGHGPGRADGVVGVAPEARILSVRVILEDEEPGFRTFNSVSRYENVVARGIRYAADRGADVINMSISKEFPTRQEREAVAYAISKGAVLVAAAGNEGAIPDKLDKRGFAPYSYPASFPGVISVAASDRVHRRAPFSNRNAGVLVAAPGVDVIGAGPGDQYWVGRGTSQATALVSGVAALVRSRHPDLAPALVAQAITASTTHRPARGYDPDLGFGVVNAAAALREAAKLAKYTTKAAAHDPSRPFRVSRAAGGPHPGEPVQIIHRDRQVITLYGGIAAACAAGFLGSILFMVVKLRRARRRADVFGG